MQCLVIHLLFAILAIQALAVPAATVTWSLSNSKDEKMSADDENGSSYNPIKSKGVIAEELIRCPDGSQPDFMCSCKLLTLIKFLKKLLTKSKSGASD